MFLIAINVIIKTILYFIFFKAPIDFIVALGAAETDRGSNEGKREDRGVKKKRQT